MHRTTFSFTIVILLTCTVATASAQDKHSPAEFWTAEYFEVEQERKELVFESVLLTAQRAAVWLVEAGDVSVNAKLRPCLMDRTADWLDQITGELIEQHPDVLLRDENALANAAWMAMMWRCGLLSFTEGG